MERVKLKHFARPDMVSDPDWEQGMEVAVKYIAKKISRLNHCGALDDSAVRISAIELNGKRIGACFGYNQYVKCTGFFQVKQTLDSLYYSHGISTYFFFPSESMAIGNLLNAVK